MQRTASSFRSHCYLTVAVPFAISASQAAAQANFPSTANCQLGAPPQNAVVFPTHGVDLLLYPARAAIPSEYSGCQSVWLADGHLLSRAHFERGQLVSVWIQEPDKELLHCQYSAGALVSPTRPPNACPAAPDFPFNPERRISR